MTYEEARRQALAHPRFPALEAKLLSIGGDRVVPQPDPHLDLLLERGEIVVGKRRPKKVKGVPSHCHENAALHYLSTPHTTQIVTGYGLTAADGLWRRHSWLWDGKRILETTTERDIYFGIILNRVEAADFVLGCVMDVLPGVEELLRGMLPGMEELLKKDAA